MNKYLVPLLLVFAAGCTNVQSVPDSTSLAERMSRLQQIQRWKLNGRLALSSEQESWTVSFHWSQDHDRYLMHFIAPFGQGTYALRGEETGIYLLTAKDKVLYAKNAEGLLKQTLGWDVPLSGFKYWVRGLHEPEADIENQLFDNLGRITDFQQSDWRISILRYMNVDGVDLPGKIFMQNDHFKLKLVIQDWDTSI